MRGTKIGNGFARICAKRKLINQKKKYGRIRLQVRLQVRFTIAVAKCPAMEFASQLAIDIRMGRVENLNNLIRSSWRSHATQGDEAQWKCLFQIYVNDVGVGAPTLASYIWNKYSKESSPGDAARRGAIKVATRMAKSPKTGLCSWINTIFFKNTAPNSVRAANRLVRAPPSTPVDRSAKAVSTTSGRSAANEVRTHLARSAKFDKILRKCAANVHNSCYNSSHCDDWDPLDQYTLFCLAGGLPESFQWEVIMEISVAFPKVVRENINALKHMYELDPSALYVIQCLLILSQPNEWNETHDHVMVPVQCYREFATAHDASLAMFDVEQRVRIISSIRKLPKNTILRWLRPPLECLRQNRTLNIRNEILSSIIVPQSVTGEGFIKIHGHHETLVDIVGGVTESEVKRKYKLDKIKRYLQMNTLPAFAVPNETDGYSFIYETGYLKRSELTPSNETVMASPNAQRSLTRILLFQWLIGVKSDIFVIGEVEKPREPNGSQPERSSAEPYRIYSMNERPAKVEKPVLPPWAYTPIGVDKVKEFVEKIKTLKSRLN